MLTAATTIATDATAASNIASETATSVARPFHPEPRRAENAVTCWRIRTRAPNPIGSSDAPSDAAENAQLSGNTEATLAADNAAPSTDPFQPVGPSRTEPGSGKQSAPPENPAAIAADSIAAAAIVAAAGAGPSSLVSSDSADSDDSTAKPATAPVTSATPAAGANTAAQNTNVAPGAPAFNLNAAAQASSATGGASSGGTSGISEVDRVRFVQRVARAFQAADDEGGQIRLRLSPPELGAMKLEITVQGGTMTAHVETETSAARNMLLDNLPALRQRLADQNIKIGEFNVDLKDQSGGGTASGSGFADPRNQMPLYAPRGNSITAADPVATVSSPTINLLGGSGQLNVVV